jgi:hypothetical protein
MRNQLMRNYTRHIDIVRALLGMRADIKTPDK